MIVIRHKSNPYYVDTLNEAVIQKFIDVTHETYKERFGDVLGKRIPGFFTDEPQYAKCKIPFSYDNMDVVNKLLELKQLIAKYPKQIILMDITCLEHIILAFEQLVLWTGNGHRDVIVMREHVLKALTNHRINLDRITDEKTRNYLMGFKRYSTERVIKSITYTSVQGSNPCSPAGENGYLH